MIGFLRFVGLMNAAVWFGASVFFTFGAGTAPFSEAMKQTLGPKNFPYFSGAIALIFIARYFQLQVICGLVALAHLLAEWLYLGRSPRRPWVVLVVALAALGLLGAFELQPKMKKLHDIKYGLNSTPQQREAASHTFGIWHGFSQALNLLMLCGLAFYLWRMANPPDPARFVSATKFRS